MKTMTADTIISLFDNLDTTVTEHREKLIELDSAIGDGDLGITMCRGFAAAKETVHSLDTADCGSLFMKAGMIFAKIAPSTMGTLIATGFMKGGKAIAGREELDADGIAVFFDAFLTGIMDRGKAKPGDKTIVDALDPAVTALKEAARKQPDIAEALETACDAAQEGAERATMMQARHGRPAYYGEKSVGKKDPGAFMGVLILGCFLSTVKA